MAAIFQEIRNSATGALDKAKLVLNPEAAENVEEQQPDRLEELSEYCPKLTFQQVSPLSPCVVCPHAELFSKSSRSLQSHVHSHHSFSKRLIGFTVSFSLGCKLKGCLNKIAGPNGDNSDPPYQFHSTFAEQT